MIYQLEVDYNFDFTLIGISCHSKDYRLCWHLNKCLEVDLERTEDLIIPGKEVKSFHSFFEYNNEDDRLNYYLISNRGEEGMVLPEYAQVDYLLKIEDASQLNMNQILPEIRNIPVVLTAFIFDVRNLRSKDNLIF